MRCVYQNGDLLKWSAIISNDSLFVEATNTKVTFTYPVGASYVESFPPPGTSYNAVTKVWNIGTMKHGTTLTLPIVFSVTDDSQPAWQLSGVATSDQAEVVALDNTSLDKIDNCCTIVSTCNPIDVPDLETTTEINNTVAGHKIADYTNEDNAIVDINETITTFEQNLFTGTITHRNENDDVATAEVVSADPFNSIIAGSDGGAYFRSHTGYTGYTGRTGYTGYTGPGNFTGFTGYTGRTGYTGYTGPGNFTGYTGYTGPTETGYTGYTGYTGPGNFTGYTGYTGPTETGYTGYTGYTGPGNFTGFTGYTGRTGYTGYTGTTGYTGPKVTGYTGFTGYTGPTFTGYTGYTGFTGYTGPGNFTGYTGYTGYTGETGHTGYTGPGNFTGYTGYTGYTGPGNFTGYTGYTGPTGFTGYTGPGNFTGYTGYTGFTGPGNFTGYTGYTGPAPTSVHTVSLPLVRATDTVTDTIPENQPIFYVVPSVYNTKKITKLGGIVKTVANPADTTKITIYKNTVATLMTLTLTDQVYDSTTANQVTLASGDIIEIDISATAGTPKGLTVFFEITV